MIEAVEGILRDVGEHLIKFQNNKIYKIHLKDDASPTTDADEASSRLLTSSLKKVLDIPVLSEENVFSYDIRKNWNEYWLIDPLDGTKEFINDHHDYCINIALIKKNRPILGFIYAPALDELYIGGEDHPFQYAGPEIEKLPNEGVNSISTSRFHNSESTGFYAKSHGITNLFPIGSALKFGRLSLGQFNIYPRFQGSYEWDIASGHAILKSANCKIIDLITLEEPRYNKENLKNNFFIARRNR